MDERRLLSVGDVARRLGLSSAAVVAMERSGKITAIRTEGGMRLFVHEDVERLAERRRQRADQLAQRVGDDRNEE